MIIEIPIGKSLYKITCAENEEEKLLRLAETLNKRVNSLSLQMKNTDEKTLLAITALLIEEELEKKNSDVAAEEEIDESPKINEQDIYDAVSENMENISDYIEKLGKKIQDY